MRRPALDSGSSPVRYCVYDMPDESPLVSGKIERIGTQDSVFIVRSGAGSGKMESIGHRDVADHAAGPSMIFDRLRNVQNRLRNTV